MKEFTKIFTAGLLAALCAGCAVRANNEGFEATLLESKYGMEFVDADGTNFASSLNLAAFSKLDSDIAEMGYVWEDGSGQIGVGRTVSNLDQSTQIDAVQGIVSAAVKGAVDAFLGQLALKVPDIPGVGNMVPGVELPTGGSSGGGDSADVSSIIGHNHQTTDLNHADDGHTHPDGGPFLH